MYSFNFVIFFQSGFDLDDLGELVSSLLLCSHPFFKSQVFALWPWWCQQRTGSLLGSWQMIDTTWFLSGDASDRKWYETTSNCRRSCHLIEIGTLCYPPSHTAWLTWLISSNVFSWDKTQSLRNFWTFSKCYNSVIPSDF